MTTTIDQLDLFELGNPIEREINSIKVGTKNEMKFTYSNEETFEMVEEESITAVSEVATYNIGDSVRMTIPGEEEDPETHDYLKYYYGHLQKTNGVITAVLPYKKLQYAVKFQVKGEREDVILYLYHEHLQWIA